MSRHGTPKDRGRIAAALLLCAAPSVVSAQIAAPVAGPAPPSPTGQQSSGIAVLPDVNVFGSTPLLGSGVDRNTVPAETSVLTGQDIGRDGYPDFLRALNENVPNLVLDQASGNPDQPTLIYRGFQASPLQGNEEGLAVYLNGERFNQAFGDTVNFDLIPGIAISRLNVEGSNPEFGLNALGGSINVQMKNGFTYHGGEVDVLGGSFGRAEGQFQYGRQDGNVAEYVAGTALHQGGWRDLQSTDIYNIYGDLGWRSDRAELHVNVTGADNIINGPGTSPVQLLGVDPAAQFTAPNLIGNRYVNLNVNGTYDLTDTTSLQAVAYYDYFQQRVVNGNAANDTPCNDGSGLLCSDPGTPSVTRGGGTIPDFLNGGPYSELDNQTTNTNGYGVSGQVTNSSDLFGLRNKVIAGASFDGAQSEFSATSLIGGITPISRAFIGPGISIDEPGSNQPVRVAISDAYYGVFATDTLNITPRLAFTVAGRFNVAQIDLKDQGGGRLTGNHEYDRFNPSVGATYTFAPALTLYASYSEANRAPTPAELSCGSAQDSCSLANFFVGDPALKQVVSHTVETGIRGQAPPVAGIRLGYNLGFFHTDLDDDILFVNSPVQGRAFFTNVGSTLRQGMDAGISLTTDRWLAYANYSYTEATFQTPFTANSENNPLADADGNIQVRRGDTLPGVPRHLLKLGVSYKVTPDWIVGATGLYSSGFFLQGDEANLTPRAPDYFLLNVNTSYQVTRNLQVFGLVENVADQKYYTYGTFSPTGSVPIAQYPGATRPRSYSLSAPVGGFAGVRVTF